MLSFTRAIYWENTKYISKSGADSLNFGMEIVIMGEKVLEGVGAKVILNMGRNGGLYEVFLLLIDGHPLRFPNLYDFS